MVPWVKFNKRGGDGRDSSKYNTRVEFQYKDRRYNKESILSKVHTKEAYKCSEGEDISPILV